MPLVEVVEDEEVDEESSDELSDEEEEAPKNPRSTSRSQAMPWLDIKTKNAAVESRCESLSTRGLVN